MASEPSQCSRYNGGVPFAIRDFRPDDFETLWQIDQECFSPGISYSRPELKFYIRRRGAFTLIAEDAAAAAGAASGASDKAAARIRGETRDTRIAGFIVTQTGRTGHVITIDVVARARRSGVGSQLLLAAEDRLRAAGSKHVALETAVDNLVALNFYKRHGYRVIETVPRYYSTGVDALRMKKDLASVP
ncbi:MAG TPA: N-acetyltransferase [Candidatus Sulfotelmatobacter sp.]|nr:N-acetyltransferase [Candidatus Sulfotelmatobacter sp.]